jgi:hypothetical protein
MSVTEVIAAWRTLPERRRLEILWENIPAQVADSMAFERKPVDLEWIKALHARAPLPAALRPRKES